MKLKTLFLGLLLCGPALAYTPPNPNGQATMVNSSPVVIASNQTGLPVTGTFWQATQPVSGTFWQATQPVSGTFWQATQPVSGTFWQATQPVSFTQAALPANQTVNVAQINGVTPLMGNGVTGTGSQRVTIASDNTTIPVKMSNAALGLTAITAVDAVVGAPANDGQLKGGASTAGSLASLAVTDGQTTWRAQLTGTFTTTVYFEGSLDSTNGTDGNWFSLEGRQEGKTATAVDYKTATAYTQWVGSLAGVTYFRVRAIGGAITTLNARIQLSSGNAVIVQSGATPAGAALIGSVGIDQTTPGTTNAVSGPAIAKGTQGTTGFTTQDLKDAGRNPVHFYMVIPVLSTATDTLQSLTGTKSGATVTATTTPAVVTAGKTLRITRLSATYVATATSGYGIVRLRFNTAAVVAITSPVAATLAVGAATPATANSTDYAEATLSDGWEFAAGTGIGISVQGFAAVTATAVGYVICSVTGFEY